MKLALLTLSILLQISVCSAQLITWSAPIDVAPTGHGNLHPRVTLDGSNNPMVLWGHHHMGGHAMFSRWNGMSFTTPISLNPSYLPAFTASWAGPDISSKGDTVFVVFTKQPDDTGRVYLIRSFDGGQTWQPIVPVGPGLDTNRFPVAATDAAGNPIVGYMQFGHNATEPKYVVTRSTDYGNSFASPVLAGKSSSEACDCCPGGLAVSGNSVAMLYRDNDANKRTIWAGISTDGGNTFHDSIEVDNTNWFEMSCPASGPDGIIVGDTLYSVFKSEPAGPSRVFFSRSAISGTQLVSCAQHTAEFSGLGLQDYPRIANSGNAASMVWRQVSNGFPRLCFSFTENINSGFPATYDTLALNGVANADVAMAPGEIHIVWEDFTAGTVKYIRGAYTTSVKQLATSAIDIELYPNPAGTQFFVAPGAVKGISSCILTDNAGRAFSIQAIASGKGYRFSLAGIAQGTYIVAILDSEGISYSSKLIVR